MSRSPNTQGIATHGLAVHSPLGSVDEIVSQHRALALDSNVDAAAQPADASPRAIAHAAARRLGFIEADAQCVAQAWQQQSERTGHFDTRQWPSAAADFGISPGVDGAGAFPPCPHALGLYAVLPDARWVARMAQAGVPTLQLRFKSDDPQAIAREVRDAVRAVQGSASLLFINDHWAQAIDAGAYGVHLGQEDLSVAPVQTIAQAGLRLGLSTHGYAEMLRAERVQPSYIAMGAVFATTLKAMVTPPQGLARLQGYAQVLAHRPLVAIGGIAEEHLGDIAATGVGSFAAVRAITQADDPEATAARLQASFEALRRSSAQR